MSSCPKCTGSMSVGFVVDQGAYGTAGVSTYQAGQAKVSIWTGVKQNKKEQIAITTLRCNRCGYLENFAKR